MNKWIPFIINLIRWIMDNLPEEDSAVTRSGDERKAFKEQLVNAIETEL